MFGGVFPTPLFVRRLFNPVLEKVIHDPHFNDLHEMEPTSDGFFVANTGNETIDRYYFDGENVERTVFLSE